MISWVHTRAKSRLSWQNYVQEVVYKKVDRKNATPAVAERPSKQARPRFQSLRWKTNALWSQRSNLSELLQSIDEDISSGAVISGPPIPIGIQNHGRVEPSKQLSGIRKLPTVERVAFAD